MALPVIGGSDGAWGTVLNAFLGGAAGDGTPTIPTNRIPYMSGANLTSSANLTFDGTTLTVNGGLALGGTIAGGGNQLNNIIIGTITPLAGSFTTVIGSTSVSTPSIVTASGALTITPAAGSGLNITLSTTGDFVVNTNQFVVDTSTGNVGIGTITPTTDLHVSKNEPASSTSIRISNTSAVSGSQASLVINSDGADFTIGVNSIATGVAGGNRGFIYTTTGFSFRAVDSATSDIRFFTGLVESERMRFDPSGNVGMGSPTFGAGAVRVFTLGNGTAPGALAATASIVALLGEMWAYDSGGLGTQLSAHPADFLATLPIKATGPYAFPWAWHTKSPYLGKRIKVDMAGLVEAIETLSGKKFTTLEDLPIEERRDWDTDQEGHRVEREKSVVAAQNQIAELNVRIAAETDLEKAAELKKQRDVIEVPAPYIKQRPAKWMMDRGAKTAIVETLE